MVLKYLRNFLAAVVVCSASLCLSVFATDEDVEDSSAGLPEKYAKDYLVASSTLSLDKKFAVIYPIKDPEESSEAGNYLVSLQPVTIIGE